MINLSRITRKAEALILLSIIACVFFFLRDMLFFGRKMLSHDAIWFYGVFHYFAESLYNGFFPLWDPYNYCGQPFYTNIGILHMLNPIAVFIIFIGKIFKFSLLSIYHWHYVIKLIVTGIGVYLCYRQTTKYRISSLFLLFVFFFSSFTFASFRQPGVLYPISWTPWMMFFAIRLLRRWDWFNLIGLALFLGMSMMAYTGITLLIFLIFFALSFLITDRSVLKKAVRPGKNILKIVTLIAIVFFLSMHLLGVYVVKNDHIPMARLMTSAAQESSFDSLGGGVYSTLGDFTGLVNPVFGTKGYFAGRGGLSEAFLYIGLFPLALSLIGMIFGRHRLRVNFLIVTFFLAILMLGPRAYLFQALRMIFPPFRFVRHTFLFSSFFLFSLMFFVGQGMDCVIDRFPTDKSKTLVLIPIIFLTIFDMLAYANMAYPLVTLDRKKMDFSEYPAQDKWSDKRQARLITEDQMRYYRPILYKRETAYNSCTLPDYLNKGFLHHGIYEILEMTYPGSHRGLLKDVRKENILDFVSTGIDNYASLESWERHLVLDCLQVIVADILRYPDFYGEFKGLRENIMALQQQVALGRRENNLGKPEWPGRNRAKELLAGIVSLKYPLLNNARKTGYKGIKNRLNFAQRAEMHRRLFTGISTANFIEYVWGSNHTEDFTLLQRKDYKDIVVLPRNRTAALRNRLDSILGISSDKLQFFTASKSLDRNSIVDSIVNNPEKNILYLEGNKKDTYADDATFRYNVTKYIPHRIAVDTYASHDGYLYFSDGYDRGWKAFVNGDPVKVFKANLAFKAIELPKGESKVLFEYSPDFFKAGILTYYLTIFFCVCAMCILFLRQD
jgi:hypothetical protein